LRGVDSPMSTEHTKFSAGPGEGLAWTPNVSGNSVSWDGWAVIKRYGTRLANYYREYAILTRLADLEVPRLAPGSRPGELRMQFLNGISGHALVEAGRASTLLAELGRFLRRLHAIDAQTMADVLPGDGAVIVHGDFAHYNCLMDPDGTRILAVLDWEEASLGDRVMDLAWCEWQFRNKYPCHAHAVSSLFQGYGSTPDRNVRQQAIATRLEQLSRGAAR
jgi:aminoglycoside phosphotransferase (APT) family kinase protein